MSEVKQNGDSNLNGTCDESAMEVDEPPAVTKKVVNNEIVSAENTKSETTKNEPEESESPEEKELSAVKNGSVENSDNVQEKTLKDKNTLDSEDAEINDNDSEKDKVEDDPFAEAGDKASEPPEEKEEPVEIKKDTSEESKDESQPEDLDKKCKNGDADDEPMEVDGEQKLNGSNSSDETGDRDGEDDEGDEVDGDGTPKKSKKNSAAPLNLTPRRSSRNLSKKSYSDKDEKDIEFLEDDKPNKKKPFDDDIQEIAVDPLADTSKARPILINDTKRLVEISKPNILASINKVPPKKEPTLVIIDTNSILSGRGPVPVAHSSPQTVNRPPQLTMLPVQNKMNINKTSNKPAVPSQPPPILLPSLTDDMFVVEAPSFIVPYVYEKPPVKPLKEFVDDLDKTLKKEKEEKEKAKLKKNEVKKEEKEQAEKSTTDVKEEKEKEEDDKEKSEVKKEETEKEKSKDEKMEVEKKSEEDEEEETKEDEKKEDDKKGSGSYFDNALGKFFMHIGINLVQEHVQNDLLKSQKRKREREGTKVSSDTLQAISSLTKTLEFSKENNDPFRFDMQKCEYCNFKTESKLVMAHHLETPHMKNYIYR